MKRTLISTIIMMSFFMVSLLTARTAMSLGHDGSGGPSVGVVVGIPALPGIVVLESDPYYFHNNYHYRYNNNRWYYARSRRGPWSRLPRDHYPKEIRYKGRDGKHYNHRYDRDRADRDYDRRGHDDRGRDDRGRDDRGRNDRGRDDRGDYNRR